jgi:C4-type Zn-finger protein
MAKKKSTKYDCPICGQYMDFIAIGNRNTPFVDGKTYARMCFGCFHTPEEEVQKYDKNGDISEIEGPFYDHKHLKTAVELYQNQTCPTLAEAKKCVSGVRRKIKEAGVVKLNKLDLKRPKVEYDRNPEHDAAEIAKSRKKK